MFLKKYMLFLPLLISLIGFIFDSWILFGLSFVSILIIVGNILDFKGYENIGVAFVTSYTNVFFNIKILIMLYHNLKYMVDGFCSLIYVLLLMTIIYCILFSITELVMGLIARMIWKKQYIIDFVFK